MKATANFMKDTKVSVFMDAWHCVKQDKINGPVAGDRKGQIVESCISGIIVPER